MIVHYAISALFLVLPNREKGTLSTLGTVCNEFGSNDLPFAIFIARTEVG